MGSATLHLRTLFLRIGAVMAVLMALRWVFFLANRAHFPDLALGDAFMISLHGLRFDALTTVAVNAPLILLSLLPLSVRSRRGYRRILFFLYILLNACLLFLCCIDLPYFGFTGKRITRDVIDMAGPGLRELPSFMLHFWWATLVYVGAIAILVYTWRRTERAVHTTNDTLLRQLAWSIPALALLGLIGRGGWQEKGLAPANAADHVRQAFAPLVTNSAFTFGFSLTMPALPVRTYMTEAEMDRLAPLACELRNEPTDRARNVVLLVVESMGREYLGSISGEAAYMPFVDSLCEHALVFSNAFANAESSSKGMCALLAGVPSFTDDPFVNTAYASNRVDGLAARLQELGYSTVYMHGGHNGELKLDALAKASGFQSYLGKDEFGDDRYFDGHWGIYDEEFLQWGVGRMAAMKQPFFATVFTLSSHEPFPVPERYAGRFPKGTQQIHESLGYTDLALRRFFERAAKEPWYTNTLFILTADHTFQWNDHPPWFSTSVGRFAVPIIFFTPDGTLQGRDTTVAQQLDIQPSVLDLVGYDGRVGSLGRSLFHTNEPGRAITYLGGLYQLIEGDRVLLFDGERSKGLYAYKTDTLLGNDRTALEMDVADRMTLRLKASIQRHADMLRSNRHRPD